MTKRVDKETLLCLMHNVLGCAVCMVDDFYDWVDEMRERRRAAKNEARSTPVHERFDLGGEA